MQIIWHGQSCFQILAEPEKNVEAKLVIDPFDETTTGLRLPLSFEREGANIVLITCPEHADKKAVKGYPFLIEGPGEYEIKSIYIEGIPTVCDEKHCSKPIQTTIYTIEAEELRLCHLGDTNQKELTEEQLEKIGDIDILMIPIGGNLTIDAASASKIISQIEPKIVIPMHYQVPKLKMKLDGVERFLKVMGIKSLQPEAKLTIKKKNITEEETKIVLLNP